MSNKNESLNMHIKEFPLIMKKKNYRRNGERPSFDDELRIMNKRGKLNVRLTKIPEKSIRYVSDLWNTLVNMPWRWLLFVIALINLTAYLLFAMLFLLDAWLSGDFDGDPDHRTCIRGMHTFTSFLMLGIETITTTGYGYFRPTEFCCLIFIILTGSTIVTIFIDGAFISVVYAKFGRPTYRFNICSKRAVISLRNGHLCFMIRIYDNLRRHWIDHQINMFLIKETVSEEGELLPNFIRELDLEPHGMLFWPVDVVHKITDTSPLWEVSAKDLMSSKFEIVTIIKGSSIQTGQLTRTQTSYLSKEIMWGYRFCPCVEYNWSKSEYVVNRKAFNATVQHDTPLCSAKMLNKLQQELRTDIRRNSLDGGGKTEAKVT